MVAFMPHNVGSYTQGRTAGDFLSNRKAAWAERCPPKTTAAARVAEVIASGYSNLKSTNS